MPQPRTDAQRKNRITRMANAHGSNENKMSDGGRARASLGVEVWKSFQKLERTAVRRSLHRLVRRTAWR